MQWWRDARFGMFIHWGLYAIPAGEWEGKTNYGEWIRESAHIPLEEYEKFQAQFNPVNFDADAWARMAADAGMKYLVITSKHHDGFGLFDSELTTWDVMDTPFRRDVLAELSAACARHGVRFCTYHSIMDWHHPDYLPRRAWEQRSAQGADFERFRRYLHGQVAEIVRKYSPDVMWFDGEWESTWTHQFGVELFEHCRKLDPTMLVNNRVDVHRGGMAGFSQSSEAVGDFGTPEQEIPATGMPGVDWETCMTMNTHWGFNARDDRWKSARELIRMLVDVASKGGNYLLNIGPRADGTFPPECVERLAAIGAWTKTYGEALYGTQASPFEELVWGRCTTKKSGASTMLYLHVFERPEKGVIVLPGIGNDPLGAVLMGVPEQTPLGVRRDRWNLEIELPDTLPHQDCSVVALEIAGEPLVYRAPEIVADAEQFVTELEVSLASRSQGLELRYSLDGSDPGQRSPLYAGPIVLSATTTVRARAFHRGRPVTSTVERVFTRAAPRPALSADGARPGLRRQRFKGDWNALPDFAALSYSETEDAARIAPVAEEFVGLRFSGLIDIARDELARFTLTSDDGARLWIDGELVVDNDGLHGAETRVGSIPLARGLHSIRVDWFNRTGGAELDLRLGLGRDTPAPLAADKLFHQP
jgi:alpha-L-fucosidase